MPEKVGVVGPYIRKLGWRGIRWTLEAAGIIQADIKAVGTVFQRILILVGKDSGNDQGHSGEKDGIEVHFGCSKFWRVVEMGCNQWSWNIVRKNISNTVFISFKPLAKAFNFMGSILETGIGNTRLD